MTAFRNVVIEDSGNRWDVTYEWSNDQQTAPWVTFTAQFPRDFNQISPADVEQAMLFIANAVAVNNGIHD